MVVDHPRRHQLFPSLHTQAGPAVVLCRFRLPAGLVGGRWRVAGGKPDHCLGKLARSGRSGLGDRTYLRTVAALSGAHPRIF